MVISTDPDVAGHAHLLKFAAAARFRGRKAVLGNGGAADQEAEDAGRPSGLISRFGRLLASGGSVVRPVLSLTQ